MASTVLFWDIDGTLLVTGRAGLFAFEEALLEVTGKESDLSELSTPGLTDSGVAALVLEHAGVEPDEETVDEVLRLYEERLAASLPRRQGRVLEGVREALDDLRDRDDVRSYLLTGNIRGGARAKLTYYGLAELFPGLEGSFCIDHGSRADIARRALPLAAGAERIYVIGDTPADVECGKVIGARTIAVASGWHSVEQLAAADPWLVLEQIPEPVRFRELLELDQP